MLRKCTKLIGISASPYSNAINICHQYKPIYSFSENKEKSKRTD